MQQVCTRITSGMAVFCACGARLGLVDHVDGDMILLAGQGAGRGGRRWVPLWWVASVENRVYLFVKADQARAEWQEEPG